LPKGRIGVTVEIKVNFLSPADGSELVARAKTLKMSGSIGVATVEVFSKNEASETLCAFCTATMRASICQPSSDDCTEQQDEYADIRDAVAKLCAQFPGEYWRQLDREMVYPKAFVDALTEAGYLSVLIPEEYGGAGLKLSAAAAILEEIQRAGCNGGGCHAQMYTMGTLLRHGSEAQKAKWLPKIASGELRCRRSASPSRPAAPIPPR